MEEQENIIKSHRLTLIINFLKIFLHHNHNENGKKLWTDIGIREWNWWCRWRCGLALGLREGCRKHKKIMSIMLSPIHNFYNFSQFFFSTPSSSSWLNATIPATNLTPSSSHSKLCISTNPYNNSTTQKMYSPFSFLIHTNYVS